MAVWKVVKSVHTRSLAYENAGQEMFSLTVEVRTGAEDVDPLITFQTMVPVVMSAEAMTAMVGADVQQRVAVYEKQLAAQEVVGLTGSS
jgi:hypothetical protein